MAWHGSTRRDQLPNDWHARRRQVLTRDGGQCTALTEGKRCERRATDVDHIHRGNNHQLDNLAALCSRHHALKSSAEGNQALAEKRRKLKLPTEQHPGMRRP